MVVLVAQGLRLVQRLKTLILQEEFHLQPVSEPTCAPERCLLPPALTPPQM